MSVPNNKLLVLLLCANVVLLAALVATFVETPQAHAQVRAHDYILVPGNLRSDLQVIWIIDMANYQLTHCVYNVNRRDIDVGPVQDLARHFR